MTGPGPGGEEEQEPGVARRVDPVALGGIEADEASDAAAEGLRRCERRHVDLELATENYRPAHMSQKMRAGFKIYGVNSTSRGRRAEWEGRELTAQVLAL